MIPDKKYYKENYLFNHYPPDAALRGLRCYAYFDSIYKPGVRNYGSICHYGVITLVLSGEYTIRRIDSVHSVTRKSGTFSISIPGDTPQETQVTSKEPCVRKGLLIYPTEEYKALFHQYFSAQNGFTIILNDMEPVIKIFNQIRDEFKEPSKLLKQETHPADLEQILQYIKKHFTDPAFSREQIAHAAGISVRSLSRMFQKYMQIGITQYIMECRLKRAADMLSLTSLRINEIADQCGFGSAIYLARSFKAHYKVTPKVFRLKSSIPH